MSKNTKSVVCGGLAFSEDKDMKKLSDLAKKGWILESFKCLSYKLKKSEPEDVIYCVDYTDNKSDLESYFEIFEDGDWEHVCSAEGYHFFKAKTGTMPIYTDEDTLSLKYESMYNEIKKSIKWIFIISIIVGMIIYIMESISINSSIYKIIKLTLCCIFALGIGSLVMFSICGVLIKKKITSKKLI